MPSSRVAVASSPLDEHDAMSPAPTRVTVLPPVTVMAAVPLCPSLVAVIVAGPAAKAVTRPLLLTVATEVLELVQVTVHPVRMLPLASRSVAVSWSVCPAGTLAVAGLTVTEATGALATETAAVCVMAVPLIVAETVFVPATVELKVPVATPVASVGPAGCARVFPLPVAASTAVAPPIGLPLASLAVTVMVDVPLPVAIDGGAAVTVDCAADTGPGVTVTVAVWVTAIPSIVAEMVFAPAAVERRVPVATPVASVAPPGCVRVFPVPVAASTTDASLIGLPLASLAVTVIVDVALPAGIELGAVVTVDCAADTGPGATVTVAVCVIAVPLAVAETVLVPAPVELRVPVATPVASVVPLGCVRVLPLPVVASTTVAPPIGLPLASLAVTVTVEVPLPAVIDAGAAVTVDCAADTGPGATVTVAVCVMAVPLALAETVLVPAPVELRVPVASPAASVVPLGCVRVLPLPVVASTTVAPLIGLPPASFTVTVMVELPFAAVIEVGAAATVDCEADTGAAVTVTAAVCVIAVPSIVAETVFGSATVVLSVPVATPVASVVPLGCVRVFPVPVAARTTVASLIGLPLASLAVTVIVDVSPPAAMDGGAAVTVDCAADTGPGATDTVAVWVIAVPPAVAETVFAPAPVEPRVPVATPAASVVPLGWVRVLPLPVAASTTLAPAIGLPLASFTVTVMVELPLPAASDAGAAATVDCEADTAPAVTVTLALPLFPSLVAVIVAGPGATPVTRPVALTVAV